jgi:hypothetical protein
MLRKLYQPLLVVLLLSLLFTACTPVIPEEGETGIISPEIPATDGQQQDFITPIIPETGGEPTIAVSPTPTAAVVEPATATPVATETVSPQLPVTGDGLSTVDDYDDYYGMPVYDLEENWLGTLEHVVAGPQGLSDFALVSTWENLYRTIPVSAMVLDEVNDEVIFEGELHQFMGSPTFDTIGGLNFNVESVRNAVIGYWQHQVDIQAPRQ